MKKTLSSSHKGIKETSFAIKAILLFSTLALLWICFFLIPDEHPDYDFFTTLKELIINLVASLFIFLYILFFENFKIFKLRIKTKSIIFIFPFLLAVLTNFPFISLLSEKSKFNSSFLHAILLFFSTLFVGVFEELAFRGVLFPYTLKKFGNRRFGVLLSIIISSAFFGAIHIFSLLDGASLYGAFIKILYSFLTGGMGAIVFLCTQSIVPSILLHALFNFGGLFVERLCSGYQWTTAAIIVSAVITIPVSVWALTKSASFSLKDADFILSTEE